MGGQTLKESAQVVERASGLCGQGITESWYRKGDRERDVWILRVHVSLVLWRGTWWNEEHSKPELTFTLGTNTEN